MLLYGGGNPSFYHHSLKIHFKQFDLMDEYPKIHGKGERAEKQGDGLDELLRERYDC